MKTTHRILGVAALLGLGVSGAHAQNLSLEQEAQKNYPIDYREIGPEDYNPGGLLESLEATADELERLSGEEARVSVEALGDKWRGDGDASDAGWLDKSRKVLSTVGFYQELQERTSEFRDAANKAKIGNLTAAQELAKALEEAQKQKLQTESFLRGDARIRESFDALSSTELKLPEPEGFGTITVQAPVPMQDIAVKVLGGRGLLSVDTRDCNQNATLAVGDFCTLVYSWQRGGPKGIAAMILEFVNGDSDLRVQIPITVTPYRKENNQPVQVAAVDPNRGSVVPQIDRSRPVRPETTERPRPTTEAEQRPARPVTPARPSALLPPPVNVDDFSIPERSVIRFLHADHARLRIAYGPINEYEGDWREVDVAVGDDLGNGWVVSRIDKDGGYVVVQSGTESFEIRRKQEFRNLNELKLGSL